MQQMNALKDLQDKSKNNSSDELQNSNIMKSIKSNSEVETENADEKENSKIDTKEKSEEPVFVSHEVVTELKSNLSDNDAKMVAIVSTFLHVHPFGAGTDYIWSYLLKV